MLVGLGLASMSAAHALPGQTGPWQQEGGRPGVASQADRTIRITATDAAFDVKDLDVKAGETVRFVVTNQGQLVHEFVLASAAQQKEHEQGMMNMDPSGLSWRFVDRNG